MSGEYTRTIVVNEGVLRRILREHHLSGFEYDPAMRTYRACCTCPVALPTFPTISTAVNAWVGHVTEIVGRKGKLDSGRGVG